MKVAFYTLGCKVNQYETEALREAFAAAGHLPVPVNAPFDAIVVNSCTVTAESDRKTRQTVRKFRKEHPDSAVILTGCMVQAASKPEALLNALPDADVFAGNTDLGAIVNLTETFLQDGERKAVVSPHQKGERFNTPPLSGFTERTRAYIKIEDGCERFCTYCAIPLARGFVRSKPPAVIAQEAAALARDGFSEIVLVGINLTAYGQKESVTLADAVEQVCAVDGIERVRLGSLEPDDLDEDLLNRLKAQPKFCPQFHLSLQSGCDATLRRMNRRYDTAFYRNLVRRIRTAFLDAAITTDIMVGFAGETEEEFSQSLAFAKEIGFSKMHVFAYSRRPGTVAYHLPHQIAKAEKANRSRRMLKVALQNETAFLQAQVGKTVSVLFETAEDGLAEGYTPHYVRVRVPADDPHTGEILPVKILSAENGYCLGEWVL